MKFRTLHPRYGDFNYWGFTDDGIYKGVPSGSLDLTYCKAFSQPIVDVDINDQDIYLGDTVRFKGTDFLVCHNGFYYCLFSNENQIIYPSKGKILRICSFLEVPRMSFNDTIKSVCEDLLNVISLYARDEESRFRAIERAEKSKILCNYSNKFYYEKSKKRQR